MHRGLFQYQKDRLTFRPFALGEELTNWKKTEVLLYLSRKRIWSGSRLREGWSGFAEMTPLPTRMSSWRAVMGTSQMRGLTETFELPSSESLKQFEFPESLLNLCSLFSPGVLVFYAVFWSEMWGHFSPVHGPDRCKPRLDQKVKSHDSHWFWPDVL